MTSDVKTPSCLIIEFTIVADRKNSPCSGLPSTSSRIVCERSPWTTAASARVTSVVGQSRSSISVLTEFSMSAHEPTLSREADALLGLAFLADDLTHALELLGHRLIGADDIVDRVGDLADQTRPVPGQPHREVAVTDGDEHAQQLAKLLLTSGHADRGALPAECPWSIDCVSDMCTL